VSDDNTSALLSWLFNGGIKAVRFEEHDPILNER
jgi:hypothetical protein